MRFIQFLVFAAACSVASWVQANTSGAIEFEQALVTALRAAPTVSARQAQAIAAREDAARAGALPDPMLTVGLDNFPVTGADAFDFAADDMTMKRIGVTQVFPARARRRALQEVAGRRIEEALALTESELLQVRRTTAQSWIALWAAEREVDGLRQLGSQTAVAQAVAKARLGGGTGTAVEAMATQAEALELENRISAAEADVEAKRSSLARWLDVSPAAMGTAGAPPDLFNLPVSEALLLASIERQGPLLPWASRQAMAEAEVSLATAQKKPDWSLGASYGQRSGGRSDMLTLEFSIDLPLFAANRQDRGIAGRRADLQAVAAAHEDARRGQIEAVRILLAQWAGLKLQIQRKERQMLPLARDRAKVAVASYRGGGDLQPWLDARRDEIELHIEHSRHLGELGRVWAALAYLLPPEGGRP